MKISYKWLKELVDLSDISPELLADRLTKSGLEIEDIKYQAQGTNLVIGKVISAIKHPDSDHLQVTKVDIKNEILDIVCGAKNCREGIKVVVAKVGAKLPGFEIKQSKIRGVVSNGMLCSLSELGVDVKKQSEAELNGIKIIDDEIEIGREDVLEILGLDDVVLEAKPTPNRADLFNMKGIALEVGAIFNRKTFLDKLEFLPVKNDLDFIVQLNSDKVASYSALMIKGLKVKESPKFIKDRLLSAGISTINNLVDIGNYVMLELGQPFHIFDYKKLNNNVLSVETGCNCEFEALDENTYAILENDIVIKNNQKIVALAGVMGSNDSKVDEESSDVLVEAAVFDNYSVRLTSKRLNLNSESSLRFIKGIDPNVYSEAISRLAFLMKEYGCAKEVVGVKTIVKKPFKETEIEISLSYINDLLGTEFNQTEILEVLNSLNFNPVLNGEIFKLKIPSYRLDIKIKQDICEEIIRIKGFSKLKTNNTLSMVTVGGLNNSQKIIRKTREILNGYGLDEVITYTLIDKKLKEEDLLIDPSLSYEIISPLSEKRRYVRQGLMGSVLECVSYNQARKVKNINIFEISSFSNKSEKYTRLAIYLSDNYLASKINKVNIKHDFYTLKSILLSYLKELGINSNRLEFKQNNKDTTHFYPYKSGIIYLDKKEIGILGSIHPTICEKYDIEESVYLEINLDLIFECKKEKVVFKPLDRFPSSKRDIAILVKADINASSIIETVEKSDKLVQSVEIFDIYNGIGIKEGYKSVALSVIFNSKDNTLSEEELNNAYQKIEFNLINKLEAEVRG